jgi:undecaprenyl-diphosphatase
VWRRPEAEATLLGLLHGPAELLPISSSGHVAALPWLLRWEISRWPGERRKELEVALHAGTALALARELVPARRELGLVALASAPPVVAAFAGERVVEERLGGPRSLAAGLLTGSAALALADRRGRAGSRRRADAGLADGAWLGLAQAAALVPGVSRTGATLAAARWRGFARADAGELSFAVAGPVLAGAAVLKGARVAAAGAQAPRAALAAGTAAAFGSALVARRTLGRLRARPMWPWAVERTALAAAILAVRYRRSP